MEHRKRYVIVMAAGSGTRMGADMPKQFMELNGKAVLQMTIEAFLKASPDINVVTVLPEGHMDYWRDYCLKRNFICPQILVKGGITRFHSVRNALSRIPDGALVAVHDGVRPLVTPALVKTMLQKAEEVPALIPVTPCVDTMRILDMKDGNLEDAHGEKADRSRLFGVQTPQIFHSEILKAAYSMAYDTSFTDDASVVAAYGKPLSYIMGERFNIKLTTRDDIILARAIMSVTEEQQTT